jgi:hypothetical protein
MQLYLVVLDTIFFIFIYFLKEFLIWKNIKLLFFNIL